MDTIGIDEVGRGALAGPVSVGGFLVYKKTEDLLLKKIDIFSTALRDSKKLSSKQRQEWYQFLLSLKKEKLCDFCVAHISPETIDKKGISYALKKAVEMVLNKLAPTPNKITVLLDGSLYAPKSYIHQKTIIKGDELEKTISCASIIAKVTRDQLMKKESEKYKNYGFENHVGYGTKAHYEAIGKYGIVEIHRKTFLKEITKSTE